LPDYDYYLGKAYLVNEKYNDAIIQFEKYKSNPLDKFTKEEVEHQIVICKSAIDLNNKSALAKITNIGAPVNTAGSEYTPVFHQMSDLWFIHIEAKIYGRKANSSKQNE